MSARPDDRLSLGRICCGALLAIAIVAAALLSAAPGWHEHLHPDASSTHLCLVTFFASGQCESATTAPVSAAPGALFLVDSSPLSEADVFSRTPFFSLLEHAPPARA